MCEKDTRFSAAPKFKLLDHRLFEKRQFLSGRRIKLSAIAKAAVLHITDGVTCNYLLCTWQTRRQILLTSSSCCQLPFCLSLILTVNLQLQLAGEWVKG
jgi:hypothetical protein